MQKLKYLTAAIGLTLSLLMFLISNIHVIPSEWPRFILIMISGPGFIISVLLEEHWLFRNVLPLFATTIIINTLFYFTIGLSIEKLKNHRILSIISLIILGLILAASIIFILITIFSRI